ncbi:MAG: mannitol dehydrogenase family protein [Rhizobacter sp.]|nr:mannitol dehydrogenase family protein [Rhizobacter sp.]
MSTSRAAPPGGATILHIGLGSFHRAHQAVYLNALHEAGDRSWSLVGGNIRDDLPDTMAALIAQHGEYTLETVSPAGERRYQRIRSIREVIPFDARLQRLIEVGADAATRIISCTVTEAGYYLAPKNRLDPSHADLRADLEGGGCRTIYGALTAILRERVQRGGAPVTLLNCDNLRSNGTRLRAGLLDFLQRRGETALHAWVEAHTSCPCNMVDRITPRPLPDVAERVKAATNWNDGAPVMSESFIQWVIEDNFIAGRPAWEQVGAEMVGSVHAHEEAKIRILNATHSCVAWAGTLKGLSFIHEDMAVPEIRRMAHDYVTNDVIPCLDTPAHPSPIDLASYRDVVLERFGNPNVRDTNQRVAMDGFSKIPGFIVPTLRECLERNAPLDSTAMLPALFFAFLGRWHRGELAYAYQDGVMDTSLAHAFFGAPDPLVAFCSDALLWGPLAGNEALLAAIRAADRRVQSFIKG